MDILGRGTMVEDFRQGGTVDWSKDWLKILVKREGPLRAGGWSTAPSGGSTSKRAKKKLSSSASFGSLSTAARFGLWLVMF